MPEKEIRVLIEVHRGMVQAVKANVPLVYYVKDMDETDPSEWLIGYNVDEVSDHIIEDLEKEGGANDNKRR